MDCKDRELTQKEILEGWKKFCEEYTPVELTEGEKRKIRDMMRAHEDSKNTRFVLGGEIVRAGTMC